MIPPSPPSNASLEARQGEGDDRAKKFGQTPLVVADIEAMFYQFLVDPKDCDTF